MQTILGSGGAIGVALARSLKEYTNDIRLVARNPQKVNDSDQLLPADILHTENVRKAVEGSSVVYVTVGFQYAIKIWRRNWPKLIADVIDACRDYNAKLVFFDNIYMYDPDRLNGMNEETPVKPCSKKGMVRREIADMILNAANNGTITALVARSADYYGPDIKNTSILTEMVINPLIKGKKATWMGPPDYKHSFTYVPDAGRATAILGNNDDAFNQVWHLPTAGNPPTGREWIEKIAAEMGVKPAFRTVPKFIIKTAGVFVPLMRELAEMMYQYDRDYVFDSGKFERRFGYTPVPYSEGIRETVRNDLKNAPSFTG